MTTQRRRDVDDLASGRNDGWTDALLRDRLTEEASMTGFVGPDDGPEETVVSTKNEAAERLRVFIQGNAKSHTERGWSDDLDAALATERLNTVERLRMLFHEQVGPFADGEGGVGHRVIGQYGVDAILDEVSRG